MQSGSRESYHESLDSYEIPGVDDPIRAAYQAIRQRCEFLTDDNHTWEARDNGEVTRELDKRFKALREASRYSIVIRRNFPEIFPGNHFQPVGSYWFHFGYRVPGQPS